MKTNKFNEATGLFWRAALFVGVLTSIIIGFRGNMRSDWIFAILVGGCTFLVIGLVAQGVVTLLSKNDKTGKEK